MTASGVLQLLLFFGLVVLLTRPMGSYMARVFQGERTPLSPALRPAERVIYRLLGIREADEMPWTTYAFALLAFSAIGVLFSYALLRLQGHLPFNPQHVSGREMPPDLAFNTAVSFTTNTNWQNYAPETTVSTFSNMVALATQNWMSAAAGIAVAIAIVRGFARHSARGLGNFWVDVTRATLYILLPICLIGSLVLVWQGVPQNFASFTRATTLEGSPQTIAQGPVASQEFIKELGTNGGGFFNANSAHPYENPTPLTNLLELVAIFLIPAGLTYTFGRMVGNPRQGWAIFAAMSALFVAGLGLCLWAEARGNPNVAAAGVTVQATPDQPGGNMEGKETRFGIAGSALWATVTTDASCGAVNSMHDSFTPLGGLVPLANLMCDEVAFGGVGAGLYGILMYAVIAVFLAGLMVGRTPEYVGKRIEKHEVRMAILAMLILFAGNVLWTGLATNLAGSAGRVANSGPHGFSEILYAYCSATANNGSAFAGLGGNTVFYNLTLGLEMLIGRFLMIVPLLAMAGSLARKTRVPATAGTLATDSGTFAFLLAAVVLLIGALEYFPALALGPIAEQLQMTAGRLF